MKRAGYGQRRESEEDPDRGGHTFALGVILVSAMALAVAYASAWVPAGTPGWAPWVFVAGSAFMLVGTMVLGAARNGAVGALWLPLLLVLAILLGGFGAVLILPPTDPSEPALWLGLPSRAAIIIYGVGVLPLLLVPVAYAWTFDELVLSRDDVHRVQAEALRVRGEDPGEEPASGLGGSRRPEDEIDPDRGR